MCVWLRIDLQQPWPLRSLCTCAVEVAPTPIKLGQPSPPAIKSEDLKTHRILLARPVPPVLKSRSLRSSTDPSGRQDLPCQTPTYTLCDFLLYLYVICTAPPFTQCEIKLRFKIMFLHFSYKSYWYIGCRWW